MLNYILFLNLINNECMYTGIEEGLEMELRLTGASSVLPEQAQQLPEGAVAGRIGDMSMVEEVKTGYGY